MFLYAQVNVELKDRIKFPEVYFWETFVHNDTNKYRPLTFVWDYEPGDINFQK